MKCLNKFIPIIFYYSNDYWVFWLTLFLLAHQTLLCHNMHGSNLSWQSSTEDFISDNGGNEIGYAAIKQMLSKFSW